MKCSLGISDFLEEISSLSYSIFSLYFFALTAEEGFLISPCYSLELCTPRVDVLEGLEIIVQGVAHHHLALQELEDL